MKEAPFLSGTGRLSMYWAAVLYVHRGSTSLPFGLVVFSGSSFSHHRGSP